MKSSNIDIMLNLMVVNLNLIWIMLKLTNAILYSHH